MHQLLLFTQTMHTQCNLHEGLFHLESIGMLLSPDLLFTCTTDLCVSTVKLVHTSMAWPCTIAHSEKQIVKMQLFLHK